MFLILATTERVAELLLLLSVAGLAAAIFDGGATIPSVLLTLVFLLGSIILTLLSWLMRDKMQGDLK